MTFLQPPAIVGCHLVLSSNYPTEGCILLFDASILYVVHQIVGLSPAIIFGERLVFGRPVLVAAVPRPVGRGCHVLVP